MRTEFNFSTFLNQYTFLYGETNTRKTLNTANFVKYLLETIKVDKNAITILDFAPKFKKFKNFEIGGQIIDFYENSISCNYIPLKGEITPPRLNAKNKKELYSIICHNYKLTNEILLKYKDNPTPCLIINDISIYLHLGSVKKLYDIIMESHTFFGNSYYGVSIKSKIHSLLSLIEKKRVEFLIKNIENSIYTG